MDVEQASPRLLSPAVRERAAELGIPMSALRDARGSGPHGRLLVEDLVGIAPSRGGLGGGTSRPVEAARGSLWRSTTAVTVPMSEERVLRAKRAFVAARGAADLTSVIEVDLSAIVTDIQRDHAIEFGTDAFADALLSRFASAVLATIRAHPMLNARIDLETGGGRTILRQEVHLGVLVDGGSGDARFVIPAADALPPELLTERFRALRLLARSGVGGPRPVPIGDVPADEAEPEITFAIVDRHRTPLIFETPPLLHGSSATITLGRLEKRPVSTSAATDIRVAWAAYLCLSYDHRLIDGADAARFLGDLAAALDPHGPRSGGR